VASDLYESGILTAGARILRADNGSEVTLRDLAGTGERLLVWSLDEPMRLVARPMLRGVPSGRQAAYALRLACGREVEATANSQFMTLDGWNRLSLGIGGFFRDSELARPAAGRAYAALRSHPELSRR
jgi:replicative DNA helicase